ncbi:MAG: DEAD/DEAH box helicase [Candidatus Sungbacteria bacterium]|nr:DEAD/DEAH box helicase [Candidatus Sungbacteria bacterium]
MSDVISELLIVSISPQNLERAVLSRPPKLAAASEGGWFSENAAAIKKARISNPWWRDNSLFLEKDLVIRPHEVLRQFADFGYERSTHTSGKGIFAVRGGIIEIWPINTEKPYLIEFSGNQIVSIYPRPTPPIEAKPRYHYRGLASIDKLAPGNYVVHVDHGIGIFRGIVSENSYSENLDLSKQELSDNSKLSTPSSKFFLIEYAAPGSGKAPDRLYVPIDQKNRLSPYIGFETPKIHRLGGSIWQKTTRKIREDTQKMAQELIKLYQKRATAMRPPHPGDETLEKELRHTFAFTETPDQIKAENEIMHDLSGPRPMDRILCGDVGFGKTEIAIRAALRAICSGRQVAILAPTTILAAQHLNTFKERIGGRLPVTISMLSRLTSISETKKILGGLADGSIDCVIGTHRILSRDIRFKNLGLVIIDEEQRFGVKQKEYFKDLRSEVDPVRDLSDTETLSENRYVPKHAPPNADSFHISNGVDILSLSATPIPRTMSLALAKLRDISRIDSPPPERLPIATYVLPYSSQTIVRAIDHELSRHGQIYFLHNRIETMDAVKEKLLRYLETKFPSAWKLSFQKIGIMHGRMKEKEIIHIMDQFRDKKINILLATTIIENGLDISSANTLIVDDATRLGLAEAHQLRGRIGRGSKKAHAYFLYKPRHLTDKAAERLEALKEYSELGQGYEIALRDLEIRGAGNVLGREQSGAINKVGLNLYCQILSEAVETYKK